MLDDQLDPRTQSDRDRGAEFARHGDGRDPGEIFARGLDLPDGPDRERVHVPEHGQDYYLRGSEVRALATIGAFRVVPADDLRDHADRAGDVRRGDLGRLRAAGLIRTVAPLDRETRTAIVTLTERGRELLEIRRPTTDDRSQRFVAGAVKSRELSHDALNSCALVAEAVSGS